MLTIAGGESGAGWCTHMSFFLKWPLNRWVNRAEILHSLWVSFVQLLAKKMTVSRQVTELWQHKRSISDQFFIKIVILPAWIVVINWKGHTMRDSGQNMIVSEHCISTSPRSVEATDLDLPHTYLKWQILRVMGFLEILRPNMWLIFHIDLGTLDHFRCKSGPLTQFARRRFSIDCDVTFRNAISLSFVQDAETICRSVQNWTENTVVKVSFC